MFIISEEEGFIFWSDSHGYIELGFYPEDFEIFPFSGDNESEVISVMELPHVKQQLAALDKEKVAEVLGEYGCWNKDELADHDENLTRLCWIALCDLGEENL